MIGGPGALRGAEARLAICGALDSPGAATERVEASARKFVVGTATC